MVGFPVFASVHDQVLEDPQTRRRDQGFGQKLLMPEFH